MKGIICSLLCFLFFQSNIFIFHYFNVRRRFFALVKIFFLGLLIYSALFLLISENCVESFINLFLPVRSIAFLNGSFLHVFFFYFYLHLLQIIDRTPTTRIIIEIEDSAQKRLALEQIKNVFSIGQKVSNELQDMVVLRRLKKEGDYYHITEQGKIHMKIFCFIRNFIKLRRS